MDEQLELARTVLRQAELKLNAQMHLAIAADTRATALAGLFTTAGLAAFGGVVVLWKLGSAYQVWVWGLGFQTFLLLIAAFLCAWAVRPVNFYTVGNQPKNWWGDDVEKKRLCDCLRKESENYQRRIANNSAVIAKNAATVSTAMYLGIASPLGFLSAVVARVYVFS